MSNSITQEIEMMINVELSTIIIVALMMTIAGLIIGVAISRPRI